MTPFQTVVVEQLSARKGACAHFFGKFARNATIIPPVAPLALVDALGEMRCCAENHASRRVYFCFVFELRVKSSRAFSHDRGTKRYFLARVSARCSKIFPLAPSALANIVLNECCEAHRLSCARESVSIIHFKRLHAYHTSHKQTFVRPKDGFLIRPSLDTEHYFIQEHSFVFLLRG